MRHATVFLSQALLAMAVSGTAAARNTGKCGSELNAGVFLYGMTQQVQSALFQAAMNPLASPDLSWALWQPLSGSAHTTVLGNRYVVLDVDPFQDVNEIVGSMRKDPLITGLGISSIEVNSVDICGVPPPLPHAQVTEYHNVLLDHYFLSSSESENAYIDQGHAGPGWERTGESFHAAALAPCYGLSKVFRFYDASANTHFFTVDAQECGGLRAAGSGWTPEGVAFGATMPVNGACVGYGETAVYRLYNNRWMFNDSNHRYTIHGDIYKQIMDRGWIGEGVAMCIREGN